MTMKKTRENSSRDSSHSRIFSPPPPTTTTTTTTLSPKQQQQHTSVKGAERFTFAPQKQTNAPLLPHSNNSLPFQFYAVQPQQLQHEEEDDGEDLMMISDNLPLLPRDNNNNPHYHHTQDTNHTSTAAHTTPTTTTTPSNQLLLGTAFVSFTCFATFQMTFAFVAGSEAMVGDSAAMMVDAMTYLFNWLAEDKKNKLLLSNTTTTSTTATTTSTTTSNTTTTSTATTNETRSTLTTNTPSPPSTAATAATTTATAHSHAVLAVAVQLLQHELESIHRRKALLQLEIVPPLISVTTLLAVTAYVMHKALAVLWLDWHRSKAEQDDPNINIMMTFSILNLLLDMLNVLLFAKAKHAMGFVTTHTTHPNTTTTHTTTTNEDNEDIETIQTTRQDSSNGHQQEYTAHDHNDSHPVVDNDEQDDVDHDDQDHETNLNMCSAYTHVFADTLRSIAVIVAAAIVKVVPDVTPEEADATAALVVSLLIAASLVPLLQGLYQSISELRTLQKEEEIITEKKKNKNDLIHTSAS